MKKLTHNDKLEIFVILIKLGTLLLIIAFWVLVFMALIKFIKG